MTLLVPWVVESDQEKIFLNAHDRFQSQAAQLVAVKTHIGKRVPFEVRWADDAVEEGGDERGGGHRLQVKFYSGTCCLLFVVFCLLFVVCCLLFVVCCGVT